MINQNSILAR